MDAEEIREFLNDYADRLRAGGRTKEASAVRDAARALKERLQGDS